MGQSAAKDHEKQKSNLFDIVEKNISMRYKNLRQPSQSAGQE